MLTAIKGTYNNGQITFHETPPVFPGPVEVMVTFLEPAKDAIQTESSSETFGQLFPCLHRWVELGNEVRLGQDSMHYSQSLVHCFDEGGTIYESPADLNDLEQALQLADAAIRDWLEDNMPDELPQV